MTKRFLYGAMVLAMVFSMGIPSRAAGPGKLRVVLTEEGEPMEDAWVMLCRAGSVQLGGYRLTAQFGGGFVKEAEVLFPKVAQTLADSARQGLTARTDGAGTALFEGLEEGLYLVKASGPDGVQFVPYVVILPWDGNLWDITTTPRLENPENPDTSDPGTVLLGIWGLGISGLALILLPQLKKKE